jgi:hypothetical protein
MFDPCNPTCVTRTVEWPAFELTPRKTASAMNVLTSCGPPSHVRYDTQNLKSQRPYCYPQFLKIMQTRDPKTTHSEKSRAVMLLIRDSPEYAHGG